MHFTIFTPPRPNLGTSPVVPCSSPQQASSVFQNTKPLQAGERKPYSLIILSRSIDFRRSTTMCVNSIPARMQYVLKG